MLNGKHKHVGIVIQPLCSAVARANHFPLEFELQAFVTPKK